MAEQKESLDLIERNAAMYGGVPSNAPRKLSGGGGGGGGGGGCLLVIVIAVGIAAAGFSEKMPKQRERETVASPTLASPGVEAAQDANGRIYVKALRLHGPAYEAGVRVGDVILFVNRIRPEIPEHVFSACSSEGVGTRVMFRLRRGAARKEILVTLGDASQVQALPLVPVPAEVEPEPAAPIPRNTITL
ncbi:MAG: PDZ domain-containing protein [Polyangiaceae bacterium]